MLQVTRGNICKYFRPKREMFAIERYLQKKNIYGLFSIIEYASFWRTAFYYVGKTQRSYVQRDYEGSWFLT